jgi:Haemolysin-type calcium binding protein related domain
LVILGEPGIGKTLLLKKADYPELITVASAYDVSGRKINDTVISGGNTLGITQYSFEALDRQVCTAVRRKSQVYDGDGFVSLLDDTGHSTTALTGTDSLTSRISSLDTGTVQKNWAGGGSYSADGTVPGGEDAIAFGAGIGICDLVLIRSGNSTAPGNDLIIRVQNAGTAVWNDKDQITVKDWFYSARRIEWLRFANGDEIRIGDITSFKLGTGGNDVLYGPGGLRRSVIQISLEFEVAANDNFITLSQVA